MGNLEEKDQEAWVKELKGTDVIVWDIHDLKQAFVPVAHSFELNDEIPMHSSSRRMVPRHNAVLKKELRASSSGIQYPSNFSLILPRVHCGQKLWKD